MNMAQQKTENLIENGDFTDKEKHWEYKPTVRFFDGLAEIVTTVPNEHAELTQQITGLSLKKGVKLNLKFTAKDFYQTPAAVKISNATPSLIYFRENETFDYVFTLESDTTTLAITFTTRGSFQLDDVDLSLASSNKS
ncbi:hypothetical protein C1884_05695 [Pseudomonas sp. GW460-R15]|nr:hypothetical protein C1887_18945 [Pseudomonas sp. GW456-R21]POA70134.1 hypothetical protein C1884_05695 [Pseudomonas sp. GW460-R15]